jgi:hypothetical protein
MRFSICLVIALGLVDLSAAPARACGGFFCNRPGNPFDPPDVVQTAENVLFAVNPSPGPGEKKLEAHIQIFYSGPADKFSWVLPVDSEPTLDVGSDTIFTTLDAQTKPRFQVTYSVEGTCKASQDPFTTGDAMGGSVPPPGAVPDDANRLGTVDVSFRGAVGPFDAAVIHSTDSEALKEWLRTNMYYISDQASGLIDTYVAESKYFVALKLLGGQDVKSIRPIVLKFDGPGPCVPLRLTAIASINDLRVNLWVLAAQRTVPLNYLEIELNQAKIDWFKNGQNYDQVLGDAANEAGGNAFTAEYAGPARLMDRKLWYVGQYDLTRLRAVGTPPALMTELARQQVPRDAKLLALLQKYIPEPVSLVVAGVSERDFYNQLARYYMSHGAEFAPFDPVAFTDELDSTVIKPLETAQAMFDRHVYLTRLATFISPEEMTRDPVFGLNSDLGDIPVVRTAQATYECGPMLYSRCDAPLRLKLPDGRTLRFLPLPSMTMPATGARVPVCYGAATGYDRSDLDMLPALETAWRRAESGPGHPVSDKGPTIDRMVADHNDRVSGGCGCVQAGRGAARQAALAAAALLGIATLTILLRRRRSRNISR